MKPGVPDTVNGTLLVELQLPARVVNNHVPGAVIGARPAFGRPRVGGAGRPAMAARTAAANIHRKARMGLKLAKEAIDRADIGHFSLPFWTAPLHGVR